MVKRLLPWLGALGLMAGGCDPLEGRRALPGGPCTVADDCPAPFVCHGGWCHVDAAAGWHCEASGDGVYPCRRADHAPCRSGAWRCSEAQCVDERPSLWRDAPSLADRCVAREAEDASVPGADDATTAPWWRPDLCNPERLAAGEWRRATPWVAPALLDPGGVEVARPLPACPALGWCVSVHREPETGATACAPGYDVARYEGRAARWTFTIHEAGPHSIVLGPVHDPAGLSARLRFGGSWQLGPDGGAEPRALAVDRCFVETPPTCTFAPDDRPDAPREAWHELVLMRCVGLAAGTYALHMFDFAPDVDCPCPSDGCDSARITASHLYVVAR